MNEQADNPDKEQVDDVTGKAAKISDHLKGFYRKRTSK
jgi:C4-dicarboxylate-specific signal transduction histidine kinase